MAVATYTVEQEMIADNDTLIITDPCYIMKDEHWQQWLDMEFTKNPIGLDKYLREYHNFGELIAADTGVGDWSNTVYNTETKEPLGLFSADAGMVIVCTLSDLTNYGYDKDELNRLDDIGCLTTIPNYSGHIRLCYEHSEDNFKLAVIEAVGETEEDFCFNTEHLTT